MAGQIAALVIAAVILMHVVMTTTFAVLDKRDERGPAPSQDDLAVCVRILDALAPQDRIPVVRAMGKVRPALQISLGPSAELASSAIPEQEVPFPLRSQLGPGFRIAALREPARGDERGKPFSVAITLRDGTIVTATLAPHDPHAPKMFGIALGSVLFIAFSVALLSWWAARSLTSPLTRFSHAAESFSLVHDPAPLPEDGPDEVRHAARALNRLRARIRAMVEDRTRMLAAIGHDLRTPITRLRLRAEFVDDEKTRSEMLRDLDQMNGMVHSALSYLRDGTSTQPFTPVDLASVLQTVCNQFIDMGCTVEYQGPSRAVAYVRADDVHRAVTNLVDNAVRYGSVVVIRLTPESDRLVVAVEDDGPGIPDCEKPTVLEPFARGDEARSMNEQTGFGLGLSIARTVAEAHGGALTLHDRQPSGLIAQIRIPIRETGAS